MKIPILALLALLAFSQLSVLSGLNAHASDAFLDYGIMGMGERKTISAERTSALGAVHDIKWAVQRARYMSLESVAPLSDDPLVSLPAVPAR